jgi:hypothetical protein
MLLELCVNSIGLEAEYSFEDYCTKKKLKINAIYFVHTTICNIFAKR